tara:strand:+ start:168 stop:533 length:366 start_codon:yes stop_codon:yes gene_type:complete
MLDKDHNFYDADHYTTDPERDYLLALLDQKGLLEKASIWPTILQELDIGEGFSLPCRWKHAAGCNANRHFHKRAKLLGIYITTLCNKNPGGTGRTFHCWRTNAPVNPNMVGYTGMADSKPN